MDDPLTGDFATRLASGEEEAEAECSADALLREPDVKVSMPAATMACLAISSTRSAAVVMPAHGACSRSGSHRTAKMTQRIIRHCWCVNTAPLLMHTDGLTSRKEAWRTKLAQAHFEVTRHADACLQVVAVGPAACSLMRQCLSVGQRPVGSITLLELPAPDGALPQRHRARHISDMHMLGPDSAVLVCTDEPVPAERSTAWARATLDSVQPDRVLVLASMPVRSISFTQHAGGRAPACSSQSVAGGFALVMAVDPSGILSRRMSTAAPAIPLRTPWCSP